MAAACLLAGNDAVGRNGEAEEQPCGKFCWGWKDSVTVQEEKKLHKWCLCVTGPKLFDKCA